MSIRTLCFVVQEGSYQNKEWVGFVMLLHSVRLQCLYGAVAFYSMTTFYGTIAFSGKLITSHSTI